MDDDMRSPLSESDHILDRLRQADPAPTLSVDMAALRAKIALAAPDLPAGFADLPNESAATSNVVSLATRRRRRFISSVTAAAAAAAVGVTVWVSSIGTDPTHPNGGRIQAGDTETSTALPSAAVLSETQVVGAAERLQHVGQVTFVESPGHFSTQRTTAPALAVTKGEAVTTQEVAQVARSLGLDGKVSKKGSRLEVTGSGGAKLLVEVGTVTTLSYSNPKAVRFECVPLLPGQNVTPGDGGVAASQGENVQTGTGQGPTGGNSGSGGKSNAGTGGSQATTGPAPVVPSEPETPAQPVTPTEPSQQPSTPDDASGSTPGGNTGGNTGSTEGTATTDPAPSPLPTEEIGHFFVGTVSTHRSVRVSDRVPFEDVFVGRVTRGNVSWHAQLVANPGTLDSGSGAAGITPDSTGYGNTTPTSGEAATGTGGGETGASGCAVQVAGSAPAPATAINEVAKVAQALGGTVAGAGQVSQSGGATNVSVPVKLPGQDEPLTWQAMVTDQGVASISASLGQAKKLGTYEVISQAEAVRRLNDPKYGPIDVTYPPGVTGKIEGQITLVSAQLSTAPVKQKNGTVLSLPVYLLTDAQGRVWTVLAIVDQ